MNTQVGQRGCRRVMASVIALMLLGMIVLAPASGATAQSSDPAVGEIVVDNFSCETGVLDFHVPVTNLPSAPEGSSGFDFPLLYNFESFYEIGSSFSPSRFSFYNPPAALSPFTGDVFLSLSVPPTNASGAEPGTGAVTSVDISVSVGYVGFFSETGPTDSSTITYTVDCNGGDDTADLVRQLIAVLIQILQSILNR